MKFHPGISLIAIVLFLSVPLSSQAAKVPQRTTVRTSFLRGDIAYVRISAFGKNLRSQMRPLLEKLDLDDARGVILDLRGNPGGDIEAVRALLECFLPQRTPIYRTVSGYGSATVTTTQPPLIRQSQPIVLIRDERTGNEADVAMHVLQQIRSKSSRVIAETPDTLYSSVYFSGSARMERYMPIKGTLFTVIPDVRVVRAMQGGGASVQLAIRQIRELSPWEEKTNGKTR